VLNYPRIDTLFARDSDGVINPLIFSRDEFCLLDCWNFTEKIQGEHITMRFGRATEGSNHPYVVIVASKDGQPLDGHPYLASAVDGVAVRAGKAALRVLDRLDVPTLTIYGQGFGEGFHRNTYAQRPGFIAFDALAGNRWLSERDLDHVAEDLQLQRVPTLDIGDSVDAMEIIRAGFASEVAGEEEWPGAGIVGRPSMPLFDARGDRLIWQLEPADLKAGLR